MIKLIPAVGIKFTFEKKVFKNSKATPKGSEKSVLVRARNIKISGVIVQFEKSGVY